MLKRIRNYALILALLVATIVLILRNENVFNRSRQEEIKDWISDASQLKISASEAAQQYPYRSDQKDEFREYFSQFSNLSSRLSEDPRLEKRFNEAISADGLDQFCDSVLIDPKVFDSIVYHCTRNGFFLCGDNIRSYPKLVNSIKSHLSKDLRSEFEDSDSCRT